MIVVDTDMKASHFIDYQIKPDITIPLHVQLLVCVIQRRQGILDHLNGCVTIKALARQQGLSDN